MPNENNGKSALDDAFKLLTRHAMGEALPPPEEDAMLAAICIALSQDRYVRQWANVRDDQNVEASLLHPGSDLCVRDVIELVVTRIKLRKWPKVGRGKGLVHTLTSALLASEFRYRLLDMYRRAERQAGLSEGNAKPKKRGRAGQQSLNPNITVVRTTAAEEKTTPAHGTVNVPLQGDDAQLQFGEQEEANEGNDEESALALGSERPPNSVHDSSPQSQVPGSLRKGYVAPLGIDGNYDDDVDPNEGIYGEEWEGRWSIGQFEERCYLAAKKLVPTLKPRFAQIIDKFAAPFYLDEVAIKQLKNDKEIAAEFGITAGPFCVALKRLGLNLPLKADSPEKAVPLSLETPIGKYLIQGCGLSELDRRDSEKEWAAMYTLCLCNSEHLQALKS